MFSTWSFSRPVSAPRQELPQTFPKVFSPQIPHVFSCTYRLPALANLIFDIIIAKIGKKIKQIPISLPQNIVGILRHTANLPSIILLPCPPYSSRNPYYAIQRKRGNLNDCLSYPLSINTDIKVKAISFFEDNAKLSKPLLL